MTLYHNLFNYNLYKNNSKNAKINSKKITKNLFFDKQNDIF